MVSGTSKPDKIPRCPLFKVPTVFVGIGRELHELSTPNGWLLMVCTNLNLKIFASIVQVSVFGYRLGMQQEEQWANQQVYPVHQVCGSIFVQECGLLGKCYYNLYSTVHLCFEDFLKVKKISCFQNHVDRNFRHRSDVYQWLVEKCILTLSFLRFCLHNSNLACAHIITLSQPWIFEIRYF